MGHKIVEAIIENGKLKYVDTPLPAGRFKAHLIYDTAETSVPKGQLKKRLRDALGISKEVNADVEARLMRDDWERDARK